MDVDRRPARDLRLAALTSHGVDAVLDTRRVLPAAGFHAQILSSVVLGAAPCLRGEVGDRGPTEVDRALLRDETHHG